MTLDGPNLTLTPSAAQALAMVIHELVTNAVKHGALSRPSGHVSVKWAAPAQPTGAAQLAVEWREIGGPPVARVIQPGFGTSLIRELIGHELGGTADLAFGPDGVYFRMGFPLR